VYSQRIDELVTRAIEDYHRGKGYRRRTIATGVTRHAHAWCVDLRGSAEALVDAGLALDAWFADSEWCKEVMMGDRRIEVYRAAGNYQVELSTRHTSKDRAGAKAQEPEDEEDEDD
jgi:hypothetical protein